MTETFWIAATVLIILALAFVLYPVLFHSSGARERADLRNQNLLAYRSRMKELEAEYEAGILEEENYRLLKEELAGAMLDDVPDTAQPSRLVSGRKSAMAVGLVAILVLPAATFLLYQEWGAMDRVEQFITMQEMGDTDAARQTRMNELAGQLREKLEASPENSDGWAMLGQSYMRLERYEDAAWAFRRLADSVEEDGARAVALGLAAQALFYRSQGAMTEEVTAAIEAARALNPDEVNALGLLGIHAFSQQDYREAIRYWERIGTVAPDHPQLASIQGGIREAYNRLGEEPPAMNQMAADGPAVTVRVALADAFRDQVPADTTLFVFARRVDGAGGPPLAITRLTAGALPAEVRLDDSKSMSPEAKISGADEVMVTARLSRSGNAIAQAGDWQGSLEAPVAVGSDAPVELVIDKQLTE
ncbi:c-type cytochrome biogenesis protein CcmI [Marinobacter sp. M216]|uniref:C-type cytochrome biogenesis protein CcmI n=1 Tax=Marinobacter albus TaxID=3030833 RepID=A0ABT7HCW3_9GAMM|nr:MULTISPECIES: c-type cytochrome biogenesis protein CcmI [unclassified Marinobacter]MBW7470329.1 c-type cytochrome biogenesis protein CcmI [Marinobacter sp. F4218]MDK9557406.1 c-type cytochrome biogenesis protein CcmI [Marinobacter sp. M216]